MDNGGDDGKVASTTVKPDGEKGGETEGRLKSIIDLAVKKVVL